MLFSVVFKPLRLENRAFPGHDAGTEKIMAKLYFSYATMNAGKSTLLLQASYNYQERGMRTAIFIASFDDRAGAGRISSRIGLSCDAIAWISRTAVSSAPSAIRLAVAMPAASSALRVAAHCRDRSA